MAEPLNTTDTHVSTEHVSIAASHVDEVSNSLMSQIKTIRARVEESGSHWKAQTSTAFMTSMMRWDEETRKMQLALDEMSNSLRVSGNRFANQEQENAQSMSAVGNALNMSTGN